MITQKNSFPMPSILLTDTTTSLLKKSISSYMPRNPYSTTTTKHGAKKVTSTLMSQWEAMMVPKRVN